jgi:hypothetical protein
MNIPTIWDVVHYNKIGDEEEIGVVFEVRHDSDNHQVFTVIQQQGLTDTDVDMGYISKIVKGEEVPSNFYLEHKSWKIQAHGYEKLSIEKGYPLLLDKIEFSYSEKSFPYVAVIAKGQIVYWTRKAESNEIVAYVKITKIISTEGPGANRNGDIFINVEVGKVLEITLDTLIEVERISLEEALTDQDEDIRTVALEIIEDKTSRAFIGDLSFLDK